MSNIVHESWGEERTIDSSDKYVVKKYFIKAGRRLFKHFHTKKQKTIYVLKGTLHIDLSDAPGDSNILKIYEGNHWRILPKTIHRFTAQEEQGVEFFEISTPELNDVFYLDTNHGGENA